MLAFTTELFSKTQVRLREISSRPGTALSKAEEAYNYCCAALRELGTFMSGYCFTDTAEEVRYFKEIKPRFLKECLYYLQLLQLESSRPAGAGEELRAYYRLQLSQIRGYIEGNRELYLYIKLGRDSLDDKLFVQNPVAPPLLPDYVPESDSEGTQPYSYKLAKLQAFEELAQLLTERLEPEGNRSVGDGRRQGPSPLVWQGSQAQFYEAVLGFVKAGALGDVSVKAAMDWMGYCLGVSPGHFYRYIQAMRIRKKSRVPFLTKCIDAIESYMDHCDEHPRSR